MRVEPFAVLLWALAIVLTQQVTQPAALASLNFGTGTVLYTVQQGSVRFNLIDDVSAPSLFPSSCIIYLCQQWSILEMSPIPSETGEEFGTLCF